MTEEIKRPVLKLKIPIKVNPPEGLSKPAEVVKEPTPPVLPVPASAIAAKPKVSLLPKTAKAKLAPTKQIPRKVATPPKKRSIMPQEEFNSMFKQVELKYPRLFAPKDKKVRILAIKVHREVQAELGWSGKKTRKFFFIFCNSKKYKQARIKGANRYDLQGKVVGKVE